MSFQVIDMQHDPRKSHFEHFMAMQNPYVGVTVKIDLTDFLQSCRENHQNFYFSFLYKAVQAVNSVPELRRRIRGDQVVEYDACIPSDTVLCADGTYAYCVLDCTKPFQEFLSEAETAHQTAREHPVLTDTGDVSRLIFISCIPWLHYESLQLPLPCPADSNVRLSWGKYQETCGRMMMPVTLVANHALADGLHISRFFQALENELKK